MNIKSYVLCRMVPLDRVHTTLYSSSIVMPVSTTVSEIWPRIGGKSLPLVFVAPIQPFWYKARVWRTDGQTDIRTDERNCRTRYSMLSLVKTGSLNGQGKSKAARTSFKAAQRHWTQQWLHVLSHNEKLTVQFYQLQEIGVRDFAD